MARRCNNLLNPLKTWVATCVYDPDGIAIQSVKEETIEVNLKEDVDRVYEALQKERAIATKLQKFIIELNKSVKDCPIVIDASYIQILLEEMENDSTT